MSHVGLFDTYPFPERLLGQVVSPQPDPRIHGYAVQGDLGWNASFLDLGWLALTGELPTPGEREALSLALVWLAPLHVGEGPTHAALLALISGAPDRSLPGVAAVALGQRAEAELGLVRRLEDWLQGGAAPPEEALAREGVEVAAWEELARRSQGWLPQPLPATPALHRVAGAFALLLHLGIRDPLRLQALAAWARLPVVLAEAACARPGDVQSYPARLPDYRYEEGP